MGRWPSANVTSASASWYTSVAPVVCKEPPSTDKTHWTILPSCYRFFWLPCRSGRWWDRRRRAARPDRRGSRPTAPSCPATRWRRRWSPAAAPTTRSVPRLGVGPSPFPAGPPCIKNANEITLLADLYVATSSGTSKAQFGKYLHLQTRDGAECVA